MTDKSHDPNQMTGAAMIVRALIDHGVEHLFGYPGGAPGYDYDKEFGNNITHRAAQTSQRLREHTVQGPKVKRAAGGCAQFQSVAGDLPFGEGENAAVA